MKKRGGRSPRTIAAIGAGACLLALSITPAFAHTGPPAAGVPPRVEVRLFRSGFVPAAAAEIEEDIELEATETPEATATPEATDTPEPTETPEATDTPEPTETPKATETPEPTESPEATEGDEGQPEATERPEPTETPEAGDQQAWPSGTPRGGGD